MTGLRSNWNPKQAGALARIQDLRQEEARQALGLEMQLKLQLETALSRVRGQIANEVRAAIDSGVSWAAVKSAYGTKDHTSIKRVYDRATEFVVEDLTLNVPDGPWWEWIDEYQDNHQMVRVNWFDIGGERKVLNLRAFRNGPRWSGADGEWYENQEMRDLHFIVMEKLVEEIPK